MDERPTTDDGGLTGVPIARRTALAGMGALGLAALAACASSSSTSTAAAGGAGGDTSSAGAGSPAAGGSSSAAAGGAAIIELSKVPVGGSASGKSDGQPVIVAQPSAGKVVCFTAICTHMGCTVAPAGAELHCPCHGSVYDAMTGQVKHGPAPRALAAIPVHVAGGEVVAGA